MLFSYSFSKSQLFTRILDMASHVIAVIIFPGKLTSLKSLVNWAKTSLPVVLSCYF